MQVVSGAPLTAFWGATYIWDFINFLVPVAGLHTAQSVAASIISSYVHVLGRPLLPCPHTCMPSVRAALWGIAGIAILHAGIIICFYSFDLPQFRGVRMAAVVVLFLCFGAASLPLTYLLSFAFSDEMRGLQVKCPQCAA